MDREKVSRGDRWHEWRRKMGAGEGGRMERSEGKKEGREGTERQIKKRNRETRGARNRGLEGGLEREGKDIRITIDSVKTSQDGRC